MAFELPGLPYPYDALEPYLDTQTMQVHHNKHHAAYVNNVNAALAGYPDLQEKTLEQMLVDLSSIPEEIRAAVRDNGGGAFNHNLFWGFMSPRGGGEPKGALAQAVKEVFGSFSAFKEAFEKAALGRFGSGWAWLSIKPEGGLLIHSTANQNSPLSEGLYPILGLDVWEHAYYLKYQNRRAEYISNWWNVVNWEEVARRYEANR